MAGTQTAQLRPDYRLFPVDVTRVQRLGPSFVRITFSAECLRRFGAAGDDQRIKLVLPQPGRTVADFPDAPDWYQRWLAQPDEIRPTLRTYTVRAFRADTAELDVDFVLHGTTDGHGGPASNWAATACPGQQIGLLGPDRPGCGRPWGCEWAPPESASHLVLAGDETAVPAVAAIVESLPPCARGVVCLEVPEEMDRQDWQVPAGVDVRWFARCTGAPHGKLLEEGVATALAELYPQSSPTTQSSPDSAELDDIDVDTEALWEVPAEDTAPSRLYGWLAGEAGVIKRLRRMLVSEYGIPKQSVAFMGYWREGRS